MSSTTSTSPHPIPAAASALFAASTGAIPKTSGSTPWTPRERTRANGSAPIRAAAASSPSSIIAAPSLSGELLPAVTVPPSTKAGFSLASRSSELSARIPSSRSSSIPGTGTTSPIAPCS